ncbi:MAG: hypothetical protein H7246_04675 [Phycisphaerae bacterium]|nr:hypothetical protein [Saprospiraceae bacterium]
MKNASIFSTAILLLAAFFNTQTAQAQWVNGNSIYSNPPSKNVGIGTVNASEAKLVIKGDVGHTVAMFGQGQAGISLVRDWATVGFNSYYSGGAWKSMSTGYGALLGCDPTSGRIEFIQNGYANGNEPVTQTSPMVILPNGNVGIGALSPESKLEIAGQNAFRAYGFEPFITLLDNNTYKSARIQVAHGDINFFKGDPDWAGGFNYSPQLIIKDNGNIAVGHANPESKLDIAGQDGLRIFGYQPFMTLLDNNSSRSTRIQSADGDFIIYRGVGSGGFVPQVVVKDNGNVLIGTPYHDPGYKLAIGGKVICEELKVQLRGSWPDYVFAKDYKLKSLEEVEAHIKSENHLPGIPAATQMEKEGIEVGDMQKKMMEKIEELTLYVIEINKENKALKQRVEQLEGKR